MYNEAVVSSERLIQYFQFPEKILMTFRGIFTIFHSISKQLCMSIYSNICPGTPNDDMRDPKVPRNPV